jgi:asparagine synthase (glutamine-hydrolysing)
VCGICGIAWADAGRPVDPVVLESMTGVLRHRGPDSAGLHNGPGIGLGVRRLSIIDLEHGDQPLFSEDGRIGLVCNGEIYNHVELRRVLLERGHRFATGSDAEVIVHLYEEYGVDCLRHLRGMFAFALWDGGERRLFLARDRFGIKPLYYRIDRQGLVFGSEAKAILLSGGPAPEFEPGALHDLLTFGYVIAPRTFFRGISRLLPGHYLLYREGEAAIQSYWRVSFPAAKDPAPAASAEEWAEGLIEKMRETVSLYLRSDVPLGTWLSAGVDSSAVAGLMAEMKSEKVQAFSLGFKDRRYDEIHGTRILSDYKEYGLEGRRVECSDRDFADLPRIVWHSETMSALGLEIPRWVLSRLTARHVKTVLTGEGSDEIFGGYGWFRADKALRPLSLLPGALRSVALMALRLHPQWRPGLQRHLTPSRGTDLERYRSIMARPWDGESSGLLSEDLRAEISSSDAGRVEWSPPADFGEWHPFCQLQYCELTIRLPNYIVHHLDSMSMAHSLETRVPFLDHELVEYCAAIPPSLKMRRLKEKDILRRSLRGVLPGEILKRKKRGLTSPSKEWLKEKLPPFAEEMLSESSLRKKGYFRPAAVQEMRKRHSEGKEPQGPRLMAVLVVQLWDEIFRCGGPGTGPA